MSTKTIVLLAVVVVLFVVVLVVGLAKDDGNSKEKPWWSGALEGVTSGLMPRHVVAETDLFAARIEGGLIVVPMSKTPSTFEIRQAPVTARDFQLRLVTGVRASVEVLVRIGKNETTKVGFPLRSEFATSPKIKILERGATVSITCEVSVDPTLRCQFALVK